MMRSWIAVFGLVALAGCASTAIKTYTLSPKSYKRVSYSKFQNSVVRVDYPKGVEDTMGTKIYYQDGSLEESFYLYSQWSKSLNRIIMGAVVDILQQSNLFKRVVDYSSTADVDYILESSIREFEHKLEGNSSFASIIIEARLLDSTNHKIVKSKLFHYKEPCTTTDARGFVEASNGALERFGRDLVLFLERG